MYQRFDLDGSWTLRWHDGQRGDPLGRVQRPDSDTRHAIPALVPGEVHADLIRAGIIKEPTDALNDLSARWVQQVLWFYSRGFNAPTLPVGARAFLTFQGLDLAAAVYLNGTQVGRHANSFYPATFDVTEML